MMLFGAFGSQAVLTKYKLRTTNLIAYNTASPKTEVLTGEPAKSNSGRVLLNDAAGPNPVLVKYRTGVGGVGITGTTVDLPGLSGFIWIKTASAEGPIAAVTGTGDISLTIEWGDISTWTEKGGTYCNSEPTTICDTALFAQDDTVPTPVVTNRYLWHVWSFHGTGFTAEPFIFRTTDNTSIGNFQIIYRGVVGQDGTVPALPLLGIGAVGVSVIAMGMSSLRKRN